MRTLKVNESCALIAGQCNGPDSCIPAHWLGHSSASGTACGKGQKGAEEQIAQTFEHTCDGQILARRLPHGVCANP